jgi:aspartyl-tRNA(Asn)/glutamyl-tRNA(Gln) amidotransferase subunit C
MSDAISEDTFKHLVDLAALELSPEESRYLLQQMNNQIKAIHELEQIPLDKDIPPARHGVPFPVSICPVPREDQVDVYPYVDKLLEQVPESEDRYIIVPDIPHTELE